MLQVLKDLDAVESISSEWRGVLGRSRCNRAFSSPAWYLSYCRIFAVEPRLIVARRAGGVAGVFPLLLGHLDSSKAVSLHTEHRFSDYQDIVVARDDEDGDLPSKLLDAALELSRTEGPLLVGNTRPDSCLRKAASSNAVSAQRIGAATLCPYAQLPRDWETYWRARASRFYHRLNYLDRLRARRGIEHAVAGPAHSPEQVAAAFYRLHMARRERQGFDSSIGGTEAKAFVLLALPQLLREGSARAQLLLRGAEIVAVMIEMLSPGAVGNWLSGFTSEVRQLSPGSLLIRHAIRQAIDEGASEYDFMRGDEPYKSRWCDVHRTVSSLLLS